MWGSPSPEPSAPAQTEEPAGPRSLNPPRKKTNKPCRTPLSATRPVVRRTLPGGKMASPWRMLHDIYRGRWGMAGQASLGQMSVRH